MQLMKSFCLICFSLLLIASPAAADTSNDFRAYWKDGIRITTANKDFSLKLGGRIYHDWAFFSESDEMKEAGNISVNGTEFRTARLYLAGTVYNNVTFKAQFAFDGGASFKDMYIGYKGIAGGKGTIQVGHFHEPVGFDATTSSKYITFMERSLPIALTPGRNTGLMYKNLVLDKKLYYALGIFRDSGTWGEATGAGLYSFSGRVAARPYLSGKDFLHVGLSGSHRIIKGGERFNARPEAHLAGWRIDTGTFSADRTNLLGVELAGVFGSLAFQGEYQMAMSSGLNDADDQSFAGYYAQVSYVLTGEQKRYSTSSATMGRLKPDTNAFDGGPGAVEVALRYSSLDLDDGDIAGGTLNDITAGVNWHLNANTRVMLNYVLADLKDVGNAHTTQMRFQIDF